MDIANGASDTTHIIGYIQTELASVASSITRHGPATASDITVTPNIDADGSWRFKLLLHEDLISTTVHPNFDASLGSFLNVTTTQGSLDLKVGLDYLLQFTFDPTTSAIGLESTDLSGLPSDPMLTTLPASPLAIEVSATPSADFTLDGRLAGLLHLTTTADGTNLNGTFGLNILSPSQVTSSFTASAHIRLTPTLNFGDDDLPFNPTITTQFHLDWKLGTTALSSGLSANSFGDLSNVGFDHVTLNAGSFFGGYVGSMIKNVQGFTKPLEPIVDVLTTEIPGLSDIGIHVSLLTLLDPTGETGALNALDTIKQLNSLDADSLGGSGFIDFGSFTLGDDLRGAGPSIATSDVEPNVTQQADDAAGGTLNQLGQSKKIGGIQFPILTDPVHNVFALLTGQNATLFSFTLPEMSLPFKVEIPVIAIPPFAGLFLDVKLLFTINLSMGYDTQGIREVVDDVAANNTDPDKLAADILDGFYLDNGTHIAQFDDYPDLVVHNTGVNISGGIALAAKAVIIKVEGGIYADVDLHLKPSLNDDQQRVRFSKVADEITNGELPFSATGSIFVSADLEIVLPLLFKDITLAHVDLAHITLLTFDSSTEVPTESDGHTIVVNESSDDQTVHVAMEKLDPTVFGVEPPGVTDLFSGNSSVRNYYFDNPDPADTKAYIEAIVVSYSDHTETYPVAYYHHVNGSLVGLDLEQKYLSGRIAPLAPEISAGLFKTIPSGGVADSGYTAIHYNLVTTVPPPPNIFTGIVETGKQTISVGDIFGDSSGAPVNAVLIGGADDDTLAYDGAGKAVLIGGGGNNKLRAFNRSAEAAYEFGNAIDPGAFDVSTIDVDMPSEIKAMIRAQVQTPSDAPAHTSNILAGTGSHVFLEGGLWDNFFEGPGTGTFVGGGGKNEFRIEAKLSDPAIPLVPGQVIDDAAADNTVIIDRNGVHDGAHDSVILRADSGSLHITGNVTDLTLHNHESLAISMAGGTLDVGDLSPLGAVHFLVNRGSSSAPATNAIFETPTGGLIAPLEITQRAPDPVQNPTLFDLDVFQGPDGNFPGASVEMIGFTRADSLDVTLRGGQVNIADLTGTKMGLVTVDGSVRDPNSTAVNRVNIQDHAGNTSLAPDAQGNAFVSIEDSSAPYDVLIVDDRSQDFTELDVPTQSLSKLTTADASLMKGTFIANVGGATFTLLQGAKNLSVFVTGVDPNATAEVTIGDGDLAHIQSDVNVRSVELAINNTINPVASILTLTANSFTGWSIPASSSQPTIHFFDVARLIRSLSLSLASGDQLDIEATPPMATISATRPQLNITNSNLLRDSVFVVSAAANMQITGDFNLYLGRRLYADGHTERTKKLAPISNVSITFDFTTSIGDGTSTIFDGDLDPAGANYSIDGKLNLHFVNTTYGLDVRINSYRSQDVAYIYLPGGSVAANLTLTGPGKIYFDGQVRLAGTNPAASNTIVIQAPYGVTNMTPLGQYNSLLQLYNDVYFLGSMPQDSLTVNVPTPVKITQSQTNEFDITSNPDFYATVDGLPLNTIASWDDVGRPQFFLFPNLTSADWASYFTPEQGHGNYPNPFDEQPYGIIVPSSKGELHVKYWSYEIINGDRVLVHQDYDGNARFWEIDAHPVAPNNEVALDASQLRGQFQFNVKGPDYDYIAQLEAAFKFAYTSSIAYNFFHTWGTAYDIPRIAFGQNHIVLTHVNPELTVGVHSDNRNFAYAPGTFTVGNPVVSPYSLTTLNVGAGLLTNINGDLTIDQVQLEVDDRSNSQPNILGTTAGAVTWSSSVGRVQTMTVSNLRNDLTVTGGLGDQFALEGTPVTEGKILIQNFAPAVANYVSPGVYVMGNRAKQELDVNGNFNLFVGRRLNANGSVTNLGNVIGATSFSGGVDDLVDWHSIQYAYSGAGRGTVVYDASNSQIAPFYDAAIGSDTNSQVALHLGFTEAYQGIALGVAISAGNRLSFGSNTELYVYASTSGSRRPSTGGNGIDIDNQTTAAIHYFSNPLLPSQASDGVHVLASFGPLYVTGIGSRTNVTLEPTLTKDLRTSVTDDVTVSNASLQLISTLDGATTPNTLPTIGLTSTQLTGLTGGIVHFSNLVDSNLQFVGQLPGLLIGLPHYGAASLAVTGTGAGFTTAFNTVKNVSIGPTTVVGTSGPLQFGWDNFPQAGSVPRSEFRTTSMHIGDGHLSALLGNVQLGDESGENYFAAAGTVIDGHLAASPQDIQLANDAFTNGGLVRLAGLAPADVLWNYSIASRIDILAAAGSHSLLNATTTNVGLYTGQHGTVDVFDLNNTSNGYLPGATIYGAETVRVHMPENISRSESGLRVLADPARATDNTTLIADFTNYGSILTLGSESGGLGNIGIQSGPDTVDLIAYQANRTILNFLGTSSTYSGYSVHVLDTPAISTSLDVGNTAVTIHGTTNALDIIDRTGTLLTLGDSGRMQGLIGPITITVPSSGQVIAAIKLDDANDATARSVAVGRAATDNWSISGLSPTAIPIHGSQFVLSLSGGIATNSLTGPATATSWLIDGANSGKLNQIVSFSGFQNIISGSGDDKILFTPTGSLAGNLDGGPGTDSLSYQSGMLTGSDVIDLPNHIAPRVAGQALNIESSSSFTALAIINPGSQSHQVGAPINPISVGTTGGTGIKRFEASNLPDGININHSTGALTGTPNTENQSTFISVTVTDDSGSLSTSFSWTTLSGLILIPPSNQSTQVEAPVHLQLQASYTYGGSLTYSASNLPSGLAINQSTGLISGAITDGAQNTSPYFVQVQVTDGAHSVTQYFSWTVQEKSFTVENPGDQTTPETISISLPIRVTGTVGDVTFSADNLPGNLTIDAHTGVISGSIVNYWYFYHLRPTFHVTIHTTDSQKSVDTRFDWTVEPGFFAVGIYDHTSVVGDQAMYGIRADDPYNGGAFTYEVTNLPPGLSFDPQTLYVTGRVTDYADLGSPYHTLVTFTNTVFNYSYTMGFDWTVAPTIILANPGDQSSAIGDAVNLDVPVERDFGSPLTFGANNLPLGLSIDPNTGHISGTIGAQTSSPYNQQTTIYVSDGNYYSQVSFQWSVSPSAPNVVVLADLIHGGTVTLTSPAGTTLSASLTDPFGIPSPGIDFASGFLYIRVENLPASGAVNVTITPSSPQAWEDFYMNGTSPAADYGWFEFLYGHKTDANDASATGAEFVSNNQIVLHLVDGGRGDSNVDAPDGVIDMVAGGPVISHLALLPPGSQDSASGDTVSQQIQFAHARGNVTYSATGLPDGLSIDPQTGLITGAIHAFTSYPHYFTPQVTATDGITTDSLTFDWTIASTHLPNVVDLPNPNGNGFIEITAPAGVTFYSASISPTAGVDPHYGYRFPVGYFSFVLVTSDVGQAVDLVFTGIDTSRITDYFKYGPTAANLADHWYDFLFRQSTDGDDPTGTGMEIVDGKLVLHLVDGGRGDDDLYGNQFIYDIGGPAFVSEITASSTTTTLTSDHSTHSTYGELVQFTATVKSDNDSGTPTGKVQFQIDGVNAGSAVDLSGGHASFSTSGLNAVDHAITAIYMSDSADFVGSHNDFDENVSPAPLTVTANSPSKLYGAALPALTFTTSTFVNGDTIGTALTGALSTTGTASSGVGSYPITQGSLVAANYTITYVGANLSVTPAALAVTAAAETKVYGDALPALTFTTSAFVNGDTAAAALTGTVATTGTATSGVGTFPITQGTLAAANYTITYVGANLSVSPAALTVTADAKSKDYGAALPALTFSTSALVNGDTIATALTGLLATTATASSAVGSYPITQGTLAAANYTITYVGATLSVTPVGLTLTVTADAKSKVYGADLPALTFTTSALANGDTIATALTGTLATTATASSAVGSYPITQGTLAAANYTITYVGANLSVTPATLTVTAAAKTKIYGAALPALTFTTSALVNGDTAATALTGTLATTATASSGVGSFPITQGTLAAANYTITYVGATLSVTPAALTVTAAAKTKIYGAALPALTFTTSALVNGDTAATALTGTLATTATASSAVGSFPITQGSLAAANYTITYVGASLSVTPAALTVTAAAKSMVYGAALPALTFTTSALVNGDTAATALTGTLATTATASSGVGSFPITQGTLAAANYTITYVGATLSVTPAALTVTAAAKTKIYGAALPALTFTTSALVNGDTAATALTGTLTTTATASSAVGSFPITQGSLAAANYTITYVGASLSVTPAALTVTAAAKSMVYGAALPALTFTTSALVNGDAAATALTGTLATTATASSAVGSFPITQGSLAAANYTITYLGASLNVTPAALTVTAAGKSKVYGAALPSLTFTTPAFVNGDTAATALTGALTTMATAGSGVGSFPITQGTLAAANYTISYVGANLSVTPAALTVTAAAKSKVYGAALPALTFTTSALVNGDTAATALTGTLATTATANSGVGSVPITQGSLAAANYTITYVGANLNVTPAALTVTADAKSKVFGATLPALTFTTSAFVNGDTIATALTGTLATTATATSGVGSYPITQGTLTATNYTISYIGANLTVTPMALTVTVTADPKSKVYGSALPALTFTTSALASGDTIATAFTGTLSTTATATSAVGSYPITQGTLAAANYTFTYVGANLNVTPAPLTVTAAVKTKVYGAALPALTFTTSTLVNGDAAASALTGALGTTATASSSVANYPINQGSLAAANYTINFVPGTLSVTTASLTLTADNKTKVAGAANPLLTFTPTGFVNGDTSASLTTQPLLSTTANTSSSVGGYPITIGGAANPNYTIAYVPGTLSVTPASTGAATTTTLASNRNPTVYGQSVTFTANVTTTGRGTPTGTVTFKDGSTVLGTGTLSVSGGVDRATFSTSSLAAGGHSITAVYAGTSSFATSTTTALTENVSQAATTLAPSATTTNPVVGQTVTLTATIGIVSPGAGIPTGTVTFKNGSTVLGTGMVSIIGGVAQAHIQVSMATPGPVTVTATYSGDTNFKSSSASASGTVHPASTTTLLSSSASPAVWGQSVTFTATVSTNSPGIGTPTGTVTFKAGNTVLGVGTLSVVGGAEKATFTTSSLTAGLHAVVAVYSGTTNLSASASSTLFETVSLSSTTLALNASATTPVVGQNVTLTAKIGIVSPGAGIPTGSVVFASGSTIIGVGTVSVVSGVAQASVQVASDTAGPVTVTATYSGDNHFKTSTGRVSGTVQAAGTKTTLTSSKSPAAVGQSVTFTATVTVPSPGTGAPTGTVTFKDGNTVLGTGTLSVSGGVDKATFTTSRLSAGQHSITAVYAGGANFSSSTSSPLSQSIGVTQSSVMFSAISAQSTSATSASTANVNPVTANAVQVEDNNNHSYVVPAMLASVGPSASKTKVSNAAVDIVFTSSLGDDWLYG